MDIARTPEAAAPPLTIRREDYTPPDWLVPEVALDFALGADETRVRSTLEVRRNAAASGARTLRLNGDGIAALAVTVDGRAINDWRMEGADLLIDLPGDAHTVEVETLVHPASNSQLMGLYASNGMLCTQCEAEGFRRITFFPDRPDVLSTYRVRMAGDAGAFPVLLSNGNCTATGRERRRQPLGRMARSLAQAELPVRAGRRAAGCQPCDVRHHVRAQGRSQHLGQAGR